MNKMINMVIVILTGIASISLLVGGIGIMNIMLVSVTERTREIGIRKALGAKERVILAQFVMEAATTSALGGVLGIVLGYIVSMAANRILPMISSGIDVTVSPSFNSIAVAFCISVGIGVLFRLSARKTRRARRPPESHPCVTIKGGPLMKKRLLAFLLAVSIAVSMLVMPASAGQRQHGGP